MRNDRRRLWLRYRKDKSYQKVLAVGGRGANSGEKNSG